MLVTDMVMPLVDGAAVMRYARSRRRDLPIFVITGHPLLVARISEGIDPAPVVLTKPLSYDDFPLSLRVGQSMPSGAGVRAGGAIE